MANSRALKLTLTLLAVAGVVSQTPSLLKECQGQDIDTLVSLYPADSGCRANLTQMLKYSGLDTVAQCPPAASLLECIRQFPDNWTTAVEKCDLIWSDTPCVSRYTTKGLGEFIQKSCETQLAGTLGNYTSNNGCVSLLNTTINAAAAKDCPAPAKVQGCFKEQATAWEELLQTCPDAFSSSKCLNAFSLLTFDAFLNSTIPPDPNAAAAVIGMSAAPWLMSVLAAVVLLLSM